MKWITSTELNQWADKREFQSLLPELIRRLICASNPSITQLYFPSGDDISNPGWDGIVKSEGPIYIIDGYKIDAGLSLWELGATKEVKKKADSDYNKRSTDPLGQAPQYTTYVFVTPRKWPGATAWQETKQDEGVWKSIVVLTAIELEIWLQQCPAVALWLAEKYHGRRLVATTIDTYWKRWSIGETITLQPDILLGGRGAERERVYQTLQHPSISFVQSMTIEESMAFVAACILTNPENSVLKSRSLIVTDETTLIQLMDEYNNLIFITQSQNRQHAYALKKGHIIIYAVSPADDSLSENNSLIRLPEIEYTPFIESLVSSGQNRQYAKQLSQESMRNITTLRRLLKIDYTSPAWAKPKNIQDVIPAMLIGCWDERNEADRNIMADIAREPYEWYSRKLQQWLHSDDRPFVHIYGKWRIISPYEVWEMAGQHVTFDDFEHYYAALQQVVSGKTFDVTNHTAYSEHLKKGILQTAILISLTGNKATLNTPQSPELWIDCVIRNILRQSTVEWWIAYRHIIPIIAEASPDAYVDYIEEDIKKEDSIIHCLVSPQKAAYGGRDAFLRSLQMLLWEENLLLRVSKIILKLSVADGDLLKTSINILGTTYNIWFPQTYANTEQRLQALQTLSKTYPVQVFSLCTILLDNLKRGVVILSSPMRWRRFGHIRPNVTPQDVEQAKKQICLLLIQQCNHSENQIINLLELAQKKVLGITNRKQLFDFIVQNKERYIGNYGIINKVRQIIHHHQSYPHAGWAMTAHAIGAWEGLLQSLEKKDSILKHRWMFDASYIETPEVQSIYNIHERSKITLAIRSRALQEIVATTGYDGIKELVQIVKYPQTVGAVYAHISEVGAYEKVLPLIPQQSKALLDFAKGFFQAYASKHGIQAVITILNNLNCDEFAELRYIPLIAIEPSKPVLEYIDTLPESLQVAYWHQVTWGIGQNLIETENLIHQYNLVHRYDTSVNIIISRILDGIKLPAEIITATMIELFAKSDLITHHETELTNIIKHLDQREDVDKKRLFLIEFMYYDIIQQWEPEANLQLIDEIMANPQSMVVILRLALKSSVPMEQTGNMELIGQWKDLPTNLALNLISSIQQAPCLSHSNEFNEDALNDYVTQLREWGALAQRLPQVDYFIGELLANYPETEEYPPKAICEIIENLSDTDIIAGFKARLLGNRGVTVRYVEDGGLLEKAEAEKYKRYATKVQCTYPVIANVFNTLSKTYTHIAEEEDIQAALERLEF